MSSRMYLILKYLSMANFGAPADTMTGGKTIQEIARESEEVELYSESTVYKNVVKLIDEGLIYEGISRGRQHTYYLSDNGLKFINSIS